MDKITEFGDYSNMLRDQHCPPETRQICRENSTLQYSGVIGKNGTSLRLEKPYEQAIYISITVERVGRSLIKDAGRD